ncbi:phospho-acceptor domain-containing protein [Rhizobium sp. PP-CC-3A-592]|nr:phospho-acceptor domain-containing protein [Rhizobium sp. PP-CC-3A-592]
MRMTPVTFLLVDDLEENLLSLEALLRRDGLTLLKARSGDQALELLLQHDVALALIDVQMPGLDGFELAELMRGNERTRRVPIIFVTAGSTDGQRRFRGYEAGAVDFIQKPIETDILRSKADVFFELYRQRQQIAEQRDELEAQAQALREADRRKDEFLATLAHELRNPLAPLRHGLDVLRRNPTGEAAEGIREMMDRQMVHLVRLIDDLLDVSRVSQGKIGLRKERIAVETIIRSAIEASRPLIDASGHRLTVDLPGEPLWLDADPTRMAQVVANLLNNAAKYTPAGGEIGIAVGALGGSAVIDVSDNGIGIPETLQSDVFQLFAQVDGHLERAQGGLGIGLALVRQLVVLHGGTVEVTSAGTGKGSLFTVRLPLGQVPDDVAAPAIFVEPTTDEPQHGATQTPRSLKVLIVDDNVIVADALGWMLEEIGHQCEAIHDGREALDVATRFRPDVILLDIGLPGMDGYEVCRAFRNQDQFKATTIIAQTGWGQDKDKAKALEAGFTHHLTKPVLIDDLEHLLKTVPVA